MVTHESEMGSDKEVHEINLRQSYAIYTYVERAFDGRQALDVKNVRRKPQLLDTSLHWWAEKQTNSVKSLVCNLVLVLAFTNLNNIARYTFDILPRFVEP